MNTLYNVLDENKLYTSQRIIEITNEPHFKWLKQSNKIEWVSDTPEGFKLYRLKSEPTQTKIKDLFARTQSENWEPTSLLFCIDIDYKQLKKIFGDPQYSWDTDNKTDREWRLTTRTGVQFTIYNYKDGKAYLGKEGDNVTDIRSWHVGAPLDDKKREHISTLFKLLGIA